MFKIYNTISNKLEDFVPLDKSKVRMYVCGPTVYDRVHLGNGRNVVIFDVLFRLLRFIYGEKNVIYARNITDVDDKIIDAAITKNIEERALAEQMMDFFHQDCEYLNCLKPTFEPRVTEGIPEIIDIIQRIIDNGHAYINDGNVMFSVESFKDYGKLSNRKIEKNKQNIRIGEKDYKVNQDDFLLWKKTEKGISWDSPWGRGRPGWHIECSAMSNKYLGKDFDIHGGGVDLKFPHHENEIAQSEAKYHNHLAKYWLHVGRLDLQGEKMSKSLGNVIFVKDLESKKDGMILRSLILFSPYRSIISYSAELKEQYAKEYDKWQRAYKQALYTLQYNDIKGSMINESEINKFKEFMDDDFNVQNVLTLITDIVKEINVYTRSKDYDNLLLEVNTFKKILDVLGINLFIEEMNEEQLKCYKDWQDARTNKDFAKADIYRAKLLEWNIL